MNQIRRDCRKGKTRFLLGCLLLMTLTLISCGGAADASPTKVDPTPQPSTPTPRASATATQPTPARPTVTDDAPATATSLPDPTPTPTPVGVVQCPRPSDDYTRVEIDGEVLNRRTLAMLDVAVSLYDGPGDLKRITQGSYTDAEASSFGTHDGGGAVDISIRDPVNPSKVLRDEADAMVLALRRAGFAAWFRDTDDLYPGSSMHIHAIAVGDAELSPEAQEQLAGPHGYFRGMDGLPHPDGPRPDPHGGPVLCDWMLELGVPLPEDAAGGD